MEININCLLSLFEAVKNLFYCDIGTIKSWCLGNSFI